MELKAGVLFKHVWSFVTTGYYKSVGMGPFQQLSVTLMYPFFFLIKIDNQRFCWKKSFQYLVTINFEVIEAANLILRHPGCCNCRKLRSSRGFTPDLFWLVYSAPCGFTQYSLHDREKYKCSLWTLPLYQRVKLYLSPNAPFNEVLI